MLILPSNAGVTFELKNCKFCTDAVEFHGHVICFQRLELLHTQRVQFVDSKPHIINGTPILPRLLQCISLLRPQFWPTCSLTYQAYTKRLTSHIWDPQNGRTCRTRHVETSLFHSAAPFTLQLQRIFHSRHRHLTRSRRLHSSTEVTWRYFQTNWIFVTRTRWTTCVNLENYRSSPLWVDVSALFAHALRRYLLQKAM